jgi:hypothetical protein
MKQILFFLLLLPLFGLAQSDTLKWKVTRYEQTGGQLFICIQHTKKPVYIEHFFTTDEQKTEVTKLATIERLVAELRLKAKDYVAEQKPVDKRADLSKIKLSKDKVQAQETLILKKNLKKE